MAEFSEGTIVASASKADVKCDDKDDRCISGDGKSRNMIDRLSLAPDPRFQFQEDTTPYSPDSMINRLNSSRVPLQPNQYSPWQSST